MTFLFWIIIFITVMYVLPMVAVILWALAQESDETRQRKAKQPWWQNWLDALD